jgi:DNA-binding NarL/FixJ family response regulator
LLAEFPSLRVLVQTAHDAADILLQALRLGARGFVVQSATPLPAYRQALLDVAAGGAMMSPSVARKILEYFTHLGLLDGMLLSDRERQVLEGLVAGRTEAEQLGIGAASVRTCVVRLCEKLQVVGVLSENGINSTLRLRKGP